MKEGGMEEVFQLYYYSNGTGPSTELCAIFSSCSEMTNNGM